MRLLTPYLPKAREALPVKRVSRGLDRIRVHFDDTNLVANAGLLLVADAGGAPGVGAADRLHRPPGRPGGWVPPRPQGVDPGAFDGGGRVPHRSRRRPAGREHGPAVAAWGVGPVGVGDVLAVVHVRPCPPSRSRRGRGGGAGVVVGGRAP